VVLVFVGTCILKVGCICVVGCFFLTSHVICTPNSSNLHFKACLCVVDKWLQVTEAESERSKAQKLLEEKEEELEYFTQQLEILREKNHMLRTQLNMEQLCKETEVNSKIPSFVWVKAALMLSRPEHIED
jgi:SOS-response transcriptional repressor LexA